MGWIETWEGQHAIHYPEARPGECVGALSAVFLTPAQAFARMDTDDSRTVTKDEWRAFSGYVNSKLVPLGKEPMRPMPCFQEFDRAGNLDGQPFTAAEFFKRSGGKYHWKLSQDAGELRHQLAVKYGSMVAACDLMDKNNDTLIDIGEFQNVTGGLDDPVVPAQDTKRLFMHMDQDSSGEISMSECRFGKTAFRVRVKNTYGNLTEGCPALDHDHDGKISPAEWLVASTHLSPPFMQADATNLFAVVDTNGDGFISVEPECHVTVAEFRRRVAKSPDVMGNFNRNDFDQNHELKADEFRKLCTMLSPPIDKYDCADIFEEIDANHDSGVVYFEYSGKFATVTASHQLTIKLMSNVKEAQIDAAFEAAMTSDILVSSDDKLEAVLSTAAVPSRMLLAHAGQTQANNREQFVTCLETCEAEAEKIGWPTQCASRPQDCAGCPTCVREKLQTTTAAPVTEAAATTAQVTTGEVTTTMELEAECNPMCSSPEIQGGWEAACKSDICSGCPQCKASPKKASSTKEATTKKATTKETTTTKTTPKNATTKEATAKETTTTKASPKIVPSTKEATTTKAPKTTVATTAPATTAAPTLVVKTLQADTTITVASVERIKSIMDALAKVGVKSDPKYAAFVKAMKSHAIEVTDLKITKPAACHGQCTVPTTLPTTTAPPTTTVHLVTTALKVVPTTKAVEKTPTKAPVPTTKAVEKTPTKAPQAKPSTATPVATTEAPKEASKSKIPQ